ncbi:hypothetical protein IRZ71_05990 [Flavobacterium sp. ANB]|uniref:hypothetical protein n=1 Tax=unclassified Flavobacterium TaxID=196869 RepID=UPI0012B7B131|nr:MULTISPECIES: hypothetical protein [unclassified Flavobacterium]MBF4515881.1 hypothetical protein [Flavobacterium sp. ANB]MTD68883.1 hypothetical protein [Flavobacterium sp. LC2016-13]
MKQFYCLALFVLLLSCKENKETTAENLDKTVQKDSTNVKAATNIASNENLVSDLRPDEKLKTLEIYADQVEFVNFDGNGDYALFTVQKNKKLVSFYTNLEDAGIFKRGDILDVKWKMDTIYEAGEGEKQDFGEWLITAKKVKDGPVSLFRKKYKNPIKYYSDKENTYTADFQDYLSTEVEYYLANSKNEAVKAAIKNPETNFTYAIEEKDKGGKSYFVLAISTDVQHNSSILESLYLDNETRNLYEYDLPNDKLIKFE